VVSTFTLCSIPDVVHALGEIRRVLKPGGQFLFLEHGRSPDPSVARWQDRLNRAWMPLAGGCHLNRPVRELVEDAGLALGRTQNYYLRRTPRLVGYMTEGVATRSA
jgi:ubiquinone/menaquinone biosynthesis C-methylase UbiE